MESSQRLILCPHCDQLLPRRTVYAHRQRFRNDTSSYSRDRSPLRLSIGPINVGDDCDGSSVPDQAATDGPLRNINGSDHEKDVESTDDDVSVSDNDSDGEIWEDAEEDIDRDLSAINIQQSTEQDRASQFIQWILCSVLYLQSVYNLSNACVEHLLLLLYQIFTILRHCSDTLSKVAKLFPLSMYMLRKLVKFDRDDFIKYIVCPNCSAIYKYNQIVRDVGGRTVVNKCSNVIFGCRLPKDNVNKGKRGKWPCKADLVREVKLSGQKQKFYPIKTFCYKSITNSLEIFLSRPSFSRECNLWRQRRDIENYYGDVFDGEIWQKFQSYNGQPFLSEPNNYAVMINVDWFQPFKRRRDVSVGVMYLVFMNLPRHLRFRKENIILLGIIPSMKKEPDSLNSFLQPVVDELKFLSSGLNISQGNGDTVMVKLMLLCASSDIPAARKLCGFMGHSAIKGCSFCDISFQDDRGVRYCGPVDETRGRPRSRDDHLKYAEKAKKAKSLTEMQNIHKKFGYKFTTLLNLQYFEPCIFSVVEPMHNLFLGTAKKFFCHWIDTEILSKEALLLIDERLLSLSVPSDVGRLPCNLISNYGQFTADEWKNWVIIYSLFALQGLLPERDEYLWQKFVLACREVCQPTIRKSRLRISHRLFLQVCKLSEELYGPDFLTPNMHLHGHLKESVEQYGSLYGFWAFSFERYNGILSDFPTNKRSVEIQIMRKFQQVGFSGDLRYKDFGDFSKSFSDFVSRHEDNPEPIILPEMHAAAEEPLQAIPFLTWSDLSLLTVKQEGFKLISLSIEETDMLCQVYEMLYDQGVPRANLARTARKYMSVQWGNQNFGSVSSSRCRNYSKMVAKWTNDDSSVEPNFGEQRPGQVLYYLLHSTDVGDTTRTHLFAFVEWFKRSDVDLGYKYPVSVWQQRTQNPGPASYIPIQRIAGRCASAKVKRGIRSFLVVSPLPRHIFT